MQTTFGPMRVARPLLAALGLVLLAAALASLPANLAVLLAAGLIVVVALLRWPELAFYLLVFAIPFGSLFPLPVGGASVTAADGLLALALGLWLARQVARRQFMIRPASLLLPFVIFLLAAGLSVTVALSLQASVKELAKWIEMLVAYWLLVQEPDSGRAREQRLVAVILLAGLAEAAVGFYQYLFRVGPEGFIFLGGGLRAYGTFEQPNPYGGYLGLIIPIAFGTAMGILLENGWRRRMMDLLLAGLALVSLAAMVAALIFSLSRGAWLGVAAAVGVTFIARSRRTAFVGLATGILIAGLLLLGQLNLIPDVISSRFAGVGDYFTLQDVRGVKVDDANFALVERIAHWQAGLDMFNAHPWLGVGIGNYAAVYPGYALPHWDDPLGHAHNYYINILAESGIIGFAGYVVLWGAIFWLAWRTVRRAKGPAQGIAAGALGVLIALSVHNLFDNLFVHSMQMQVGITLGLIDRIGRSEY